MTDPAAPTLGWRSSLRYLLQADTIVQVRNRRSIYLSLVLPLILLFALSAGKRANALGPPDLRTAMSLTVGLVSIGVIGHSMAVARDRDTGVFQRLRVSPAPTWTIMVSRFLVQLVTALVMSVIVLVAAAAFQNVTLSPVGYALTLLMIVVGAMVFLSIGQAIVGLIRSAETLNAAGRLLYVPILVLSLFGHTDVLGTTIEYISRYSPGGAFASLLSGAMAPDTSWTTDTWIAIPVCLGYALVFAVIGIKWFRWTSR